MSYRDDIDGILKMCSGQGVSKSDIAHYILERFEEIKEGLFIKQDVDDYKKNCFGLECIRQILNFYSDGKIDISRTIKFIDSIKDLSKFYLMIKGYYSGEAEDRQKREFQAARNLFRNTNQFSLQAKF